MNNPNTQHSEKAKLPEEQGRHFQGFTINPSRESAPIRSFVGSCGGFTPHHKTPSIVTKSLQTKNQPPLENAVTKARKMQDWKMQLLDSEIKHSNPSMEFNAFTLKGFS